eukprot:scaffold5966_cov118-Cylindrotheca_fusiformis.AAC.26
MLCIAELEDEKYSPTRDDHLSKPVLIVSRENLPSKEYLMPNTHLMLVRNNIECRTRVPATLPTWQPSELWSSGIGLLSIIAGGTE